MSTGLSPQQVVADNRPVSVVRVVAHTTGATGPNTSENHWSIYLILKNIDGAVRMNMRANYGDPRGILEWTAMNYAVSNSTLKSWDFAAANGVTVAHIAGLIYSRHRERYSMSGGGSGCRWWIYAVIGDLANEGYIAADAAQTLWPHLLKQYHRTREPIQLNMVRGTFSSYTQENEFSVKSR